ncbi:ribonuclease toxin immunity protein CdiI [Pseudomonas aeruginosa]
MLVKELFGQPYSESDPYWVVKGYFDRMYDDGYFIEAVGYIVKRWGFSTDGAYCNFPDVARLICRYDSRVLHKRARVVNRRLPRC